MQHQPQRVVGGQQRQAIAAQLVPQCSGLHQSLAQLPASSAAAPVVQRGFTGGQKQCTGAGGLQPAQAALQRSDVHALPLLPEHGGLSQSRRRFLQGMHHQIGPPLQRTWGQLWIHVCSEMTAMGLIHQHGPAPLLQASDQRCRVKPIALIGGMHQHCRADRWMLRRKGRKNALEPRSISGSGVAAVWLVGQIEQQWRELAKQAGLNQTAVRIARHQHRLPRAADAQQGRLQQSCGSVDAVPAAVDPHRIRCSTLAVGHGSVVLQWPPQRRQFRQVPEAGGSLQQPPHRRREG